MIDLLCKLGSFIYSEQSFTFAYNHTALKIRYPVRSAKSISTWIGDVLGISSVVMDSDNRTLLDMYRQLKTLSTADQKKLINDESVMCSAGHVLGSVSEIPTLGTLINWSKTKLVKVTDSTSDNRHQQIVADIEGPLLDIDRRFNALSLAHQKKLINKERERVMVLVRNVLGNRAEIPAFVFNSTSSKLMKFFGFDPFKWFYFEEYDHNTRFANRAFSNPSITDAMEQAGQILEEKRSPYLKRISNRFHQKVTSVADVDRAADIIIDFCKSLPSARNGVDLPINVNDVKILCVDGIKHLLASEISNKRSEIPYSKAHVLPYGELCWVKYKFVSNTSIERHFIFVDKVCDSDVTICYYWFASEIDFRQALRRIERVE